MADIVHADSVDYLYTRLKADYCRYFLDFAKDAEKADFSRKAMAISERTLDTATKNLTPTSNTRLSNIDRQSPNRRRGFGAAGGGSLGIGIGTMDARAHLVTKRRITP